MPAEEYAAFSQRISADAALRDDVNKIRLLLVGIQEATLEAEITGFHKGLPAKEIIHPSHKKSGYRQWLAVAALIAIIAIGSWVFFIRSTQNERLFSEYYKPDPGLISAMSTSDNYTFDRAMIDYKTGQYDSAIKAWQGLLTTKPDNDTLNYFVGSAYLAKKETNKAIIHFKKVIAVADSYFLKEAYWYMGLALLKEDNKKEAIPFIEKADHEQKDVLLLKWRK